jgi:uncharacterized membrane protein
MGPRDGDLSWRHQLAGFSVEGAVAIMNAASDDARGRYNRAKGLLSLYGESDDAGDVFVRGRQVSAVTSIAMLAPLLLVVLCLLLGSATQALFGPTVATIPLGVGFLLNGAAVINAFALIGLSQEIGVVDHTTEAAPDAVDELKERYVAGEIDDAELEREAAEVWER